MLSTLFFLSRELSLMLYDVSKSNFHQSIYRPYEERNKRFREKSFLRKQKKKQNTERILSCKGNLLIQQMQTTNSRIRLSYFFSVLWRHSITTELLCLFLLYFFFILFVRIFIAFEELKKCACVFTPFSFSGFFFLYPPDDSCLII